jgi:hypothetical protein
MRGLERELLEDLHAETLMSAPRQGRATRPDALRSRRLYLLFRVDEPVRQTTPGEIE